MAKKDINNDKKKKNFFKELKSELKKVTWPTFKKLVNNTSAVISIVLILAVIVFVLDVCFEKLNDLGVGKLKELVSSNTEEVSETTNETDSNEVVEDNTDVQEDSTNVEEINADESTENTEGQSETDNTSEENVAQ